MNCPRPWAGTVWGDGWSVSADRRELYGKLKQAFGG